MPGVDRKPLPQLAEGITLSDDEPTRSTVNDIHLINHLSLLDTQRTCR
jgi:hypothetical protein